MRQTFKVVAVQQLYGVLLRDGQELGLVDGGPGATEAAVAITGSTPEKNKCSKFEIVK